VSDRLGLIAGGGRLPLEIARAAGGRPVHAVAFPGITDPDLGAVVDEVDWQPLGAVEAVLEGLRHAAVAEIVLAGKVALADFVRSPEAIEPDARARALLGRMKDRRDARLLDAVASMLEDEGFTVLPQASLVPHLLPRPGVLGKVEPPASAAADLRLGWRLAGRLAASGVGQCLAVKGGHVVAVEALEGTDAAVERAVDLAGSGITVVKRSAPGHDPRFDLPAVGPRTIEPLARAGGGVLALEAGGTLVLDRGHLLERADATGVAVIAVGSDGPSAVGGAHG
jgi:DUF1009 family protein